ncbi:MAG: type III secretion system chaperone [Paracoccaceae bacterium]
MIDANHALDAIARKLNLAKLSFTDSQVGIDVKPDLTIFLSLIDDTTIEASCLLEFLGNADAPMLRAMLEANYLGGAVGHGRLAIDAGSGDVILCESWNLAELDVSSLEARLDVFTNTAEFWLTPGSKGLLERADSLRIATSREDEANAIAQFVQTDEDDQTPILMRL